MKKLIFVIMASALLLSCNRENENMYENDLSDIATVDNSAQSTKFFLNLDNKERLYTMVSDLRYYRPKDGQRVIANYVILSNKSDTSTYNHDVKLIDVYEILTKGIFRIKPVQQDSIGNDQIEIRQMWIGSDYLNVEFSYPGYNKIHFISLISDSTKTYTDNKIHLEFRHNANGDYPSISKWGMASFDLRSLQSNATNDSLQLVIHTKEYRSTGDNTYSMTYKFNTPSLVSARKISIPKNAEKAY
ncbi:MAG: hypothetical protein GZ091_03960 [Paludibacter sp.]|nr:hypothetical protein [Paludibacter sp.]